MLSDDLLAWYDAHARDLPWRVPPAASKRGVRSDPYHVWLSEIMLQQTTVKAVIPYFEAFRARWPGVADMAAADAADVMEMWAGLGYYARARNMHGCARVVTREHGGRFPRTETELRALPGLGEYTAAAIAAIAFGRHAAVVDGNIERVAARVLADPTPKPRLKPVARRWMDENVPADAPGGRPGDFVQAVMDLGATICTPRRPLCALCPLNAACRAFREGDPLDLPVPAPRKARPVRRGAVFVARRGDGAVWVVRRPPAGLLGGTLALPTTDWSAKRDGATGAEAAPFRARWRHVGTTEHGFTHFLIRLDVYAAETDEATGDGWWECDPALPTLFRKVRAVAERDRSTGPPGRNESG